MRNKLLVLLFTALTLAFIQPLALAAVKPGMACKVLGKTSTSSGIKYTCVKSGKKLIWNKGVAVKKATPAPTPTPTPTPSATPAPDLYAGLEPVLSSVSRTKDGFVFYIDNWNSAYTYQTTTSSGVVTLGRGRLGRMPVTVTGLEPGEAATVDIAVDRNRAARVIHIFLLSFGILFLITKYAPAPVAEIAKATN